MTDEHNFQEIKDDFLSLESNPGWKRLTEIVDEQIHNRRESLELKGGELEPEAIRYTLGEIGALRLFLSIPGHQIEECDAILKALPEDTEEEIEDYGN